MDIEILGFLGAMIFLIGIGHKSDEGLIIEQLFASSGAKEEAILRAFNKAVFFRIAGSRP